MSDIIFKKRVIEKEVVKYQLYLEGERKKQRQSTKEKEKEALRSKLIAGCQPCHRVRWWGDSSEGVGGPQ